MTLISFTHRIGSMGLATAKLVAEKLNLDLYDNNRLQDEARKVFQEQGEVQWMDEKAPNFLERLLNNNYQSFLNVMEAVVYKAANSNNAILLGHGSQILLQDFDCALHVFAHASIPTRVQNMMNSRDLSEEAATKLIHKMDQEQNGFFKYAFHQDLEDVSLYDLVLNTEKISASNAASLIIQAADTPEIQSCSLNALDSMQRLSLLRRIKAALLKKNISMNTLYIDVPQQGIVALKGMVGTQEEKKEIVDTVEQISEISEVRADLSITPPGY